MTNNDNQYLVPNEQTNKMVDVKPLLELCSGMGAKEAAATIDEAIKRMVVASHPDFNLNDNVETFTSLYLIRDMFIRIGNCNISIEDQERNDRRWNPKNKRDE